MIYAGSDENDMLAWTFQKHRDNEKTRKACYVSFFQRIIFSLFYIIYMITKIILCSLCQIFSISSLFCFSIRYSFATLDYVAFTSKLFISKFSLFSYRKIVPLTYNIKIIACWQNGNHLGTVEKQYFSQGNLDTLRQLIYHTYFNSERRFAKN